MSSMEPTALQQLIALAASHGWLPLIMLATLYVRKILSPASGFPLTIPPKVLPIVSALGGLVYGFEQSLATGQKWDVALLGMAIAAGGTGFLDSILTAIFDHDNAPAWARAIVFVFDDLTKGGGAGGAGSTKLRMPGGKAFSAPPTVVVTPPVPIVPANPRRSRRFGVRMAALVTGASVGVASVATTGCTPAQWANFVQTETQLVTYVQTFLTGASTLWQFILPLIPASSQTQATSDFKTAMLTANNALAALQEAVQAGTAAEQQPADWATLVTNVQAAVASLVAIVELYQPAQMKASASSPYVAFEAQAAHIKAWK